MIGMPLKISHDDSADSRTLLALAVFQYLSKEDYVRSIHIYDQGGTTFTIQQEFSLSPGAFSQISEPIPSAYFCSFSSSGLKQFMVMLKKVQENDNWKCVLEFLSDCPSETSIIPLLSVSRNSDLQDIPSLAHDLHLVELHLVERAVEGKTSFGRPSEVLCDTSMDFCGPNVSELEQSTLKHANWTLPALSTSPVGQSLEQKDDMQKEDAPDRTPLNLQLDIWQGWGPELEFASPRISETFDICSWRASAGEPSLPYTATMRASSPSSSSFTGQNTDNFSWSPSFLAFNLPITPDYPSENLPMQVNNMLPCLKHEDNGIPLPATFVSLRNPVIAHHGELDHFALNGSPCDIMSNMEELEGTSPCSDESVGTGGGNGKPGPAGLTHLCLTSESNDPKLASCGSDDFRDWIESPATSSAVHWGGREGRSTRKSVRDRSSEGNSHHRGSGERMTEITLSELSQYFNMPITQASKELKVGLTVLKKRCREFGIPRWPHRKMKSLDSLIQNMQDLARRQGDKNAACVLNAVKKLAKQKAAMEEMPGTELAESTKRLRQACFKASYKKRRQQAQSHSEEACDEMSTSVSSSDLCTSVLCQ